MKFDTVQHAIRRYHPICSNTTDCITKRSFYKPCVSVPL